MLFGINLNFFFIKNTILLLSLIYIIYIFIKFSIIKFKGSKIILYLVSKNDNYLNFKYFFDGKEQLCNINIQKKAGSFGTSNNNSSRLSYYLFGIFYDFRTNQTYVSWYSIDKMNIGDAVDSIIYNNKIYIEKKYFLKNNIPTREPNLMLRMRIIFLISIVIIIFCLLFLK